MKPWIAEHYAHYCGDYVYSKKQLKKDSGKYIVKKIHIYHDMDFYMGYISEGYNTDSEDMHTRCNFLVWTFIDNKITLTSSKSTAA